MLPRVSLSILFFLRPLTSRVLSFQKNKHVSLGTKGTDLCHDHKTPRVLGNRIIFIGG